MDNIFDVNRPRVEYKTINIPQDHLITEDLRYMSVIINIAECYLLSVRGYTGTYDGEWQAMDNNYM